MMNMNFQCQVAKTRAGLGAGFFSVNYQFEEGEKSNIVSVKWKTLKVIKQFGLPQIDLGCFSAFFPFIVEIITADLRASKRCYCMQKYQEKCLLPQELQ